MIEDKMVKCATYRWRCRDLTRCKSRFAKLISTPGRVFEEVRTGPTIL